MMRLTSALAALATVATLGVGTAAAMESEHDMLTGKVFNTLTRLNISTEGMADLTLGQITRIVACQNTDESEGRIKACIEAAVRNR